MTQDTTRIDTSLFRQTGSKRAGLLLKRLFDLLVAAAGLLTLSPLFLLIAVRLRRDTPGPVLYRGSRVGRDGRIFKIIKFRTMYEDPASFNGPRITAEDDPRITPFGRTLRGSKLNELPQLWNVLKGDMSLVGPRPEDPSVVAQWPAAVRNEVLSLRPGITSPTSVRYRNEEEMLNSEQVMDSYMAEILPSKLRLDQLYVRHRSFWGDLDVLFWTSLLLAPRLDAYQPSDQRLFVGPFNEFMRRYLNWFLADLLVAFAAIGLTGLLWRSFGPLDIGWRTALLFAVGFALLCSLAGSLFGLQRISWSRSSGSDALDLLLPVSLATLLVFLINQFILMKDPDDSYRVLVSIFNNQPLLPPAMILVAALLSLVGFIAVRYRSRLFTGVAKRWLELRRTATGPQERVLIIGGGETGEFASWMLSEGSYRSAFRVVGFVDDDLFIQGTRIRGLRVLGSRVDIPNLVAKHDVGIILFAIHNISRSDRADLLRICRATPARILVFPDIPAALSGISRARNGRKSQAASPTASADLPCDLCLTRTSPTRVDAWLAQVDDLIARGEFDIARLQIQEIRSRLRDDAPLPVSYETKTGSLPE